jgi:hypothetical protein
VPPANPFPAPSGSRSDRASYLAVWIGLLVVGVAAMAAILWLGEQASVESSGLATARAAGLGVGVVVVLLLGWFVWRETQAPPEP